MTNIDIINDLDASGKLRQLVKGGYFPAKILLHREIYLYVDARVKAGVKFSEAVNNAAEGFDCTNRCVYKVVKSMKL